MADKWLIADVKSVQKVIFESNRLVQMRGGSFLLSSLDSLLEDLVGAARTEIAAGGQYRFRVPAAEADATKATIRRAFEEHTGLPAGRFQIAIVDAIDPEAGNTAEARQERYASLGRGQSEGRSYSLAPDSGLIQVCELCASRPATVLLQSTAKGEDPSLACRVCERRQSVALEGRNELWEQFDLASRPSNDLSDFSSDARPENYVAVLAADGDGIGARLREIEDDQAFSNAMRSAIQRACKAAAEREHDDDDGEPVPMIPQWVGGDDALLVLHPQHALGAASRLLRTFAREMAAAGYGGFTLSAGVAIAHASVPMHHFIEQAEELLALAKGHRRRLGGGVSETCAGFVDFEVITEAFSASPIERRPRATPAIEVVHADERSRPGPDLDGLLALVHEMHDRDVARRAVQRFAAGDPDSGLPDFDGLDAVRSSGLASRLAELYYLEGR